MVFLTRFITALVLLYIAVGCLLFYRDFLYNTAVLGIPLPVSIGFGMIIAQVFLSLLLVLGLFSRFAAGASVICLSAVGFVFFGADLNKIYVALILLLITALLPTFLMAPGRYSLDFNRARRRVEKEFRG
jgi:uncharacterized membrane protein YphA (DoxX/SURF4 family)